MSALCLLEIDWSSAQDQPEAQRSVSNDNPVDAWPSESTAEPVAISEQELLKEEHSVALKEESAPFAR
jgi:hypothetical protein